jgi:hypothetical protein
MTKRHMAATALAAALVLPLSVRAHGIVGDRFFPATIATDDPFAADELALPTIGLGNREEDYDFEWSKTIFPHIAVSIAGGYTNAHAPGGPDASGWDNFEVTPAWQFFTDPDSETVATAGMRFEIGGSGSHAVADTFTTYTPTLLFGQGFGFLPDSVALLRPLAITGTVGYSIPGTSTVSKAIAWGGALEYSLRYLRDNVRDAGLGDIASHLTPIVEVSIDSPTDTGGTTGTINPGILWSGQYSQLGIEAVIPVNGASGSNIGAAMQLHFYVDDIFPQSLGTPIFGGNH